MTPARFTVLAVCTANICRSPLMEILLKAQLDSDKFEVASAGVRGWDQQPMDSMAAMEAARLGHEATAFRSQPISSYLIESADLIVTATRTHRSEVLSKAPAALRRSFTLVEFAALTARVEASSPTELVAQAALNRSLAPAKVDVDDPYRRSPDAHRAAADQIAEAVATISARLNLVAGQPAI
jgi:protein-tyrosine phosphatase